MNGRRKPQPAAFGPRRLGEVMGVQPLVPRQAIAFGPVPARAVGDIRLSLRHMQALTAIAMHDRFSALNAGRGCTVNLKTLSLKCNANYTVFSRTVSDLVDWGYVTKERHGNRITLRVVYDDEADGDLVLSDGKWRKRHVAGAADAAEGMPAGLSQRRSERRRPVRPRYRR